MLLPRVRRAPRQPRPQTKVYGALRMSAFDGDPGVRPSLRAFVADAAPWEPIPDDGLEHFDGARG